jgi:hypothetical protein
VLLHGAAVLVADVHAEDFDASRRCSVVTQTRCAMLRRRGVP